MSSWVRAVAVVAAVALTAGCAPASLPVEVGPQPTSSVSQAPLQVTGVGGAPPTLDYEKPFAVVRPASQTVWPGTGDLLERDDPVLLNLYAEDGRDGTELQNTFRTAPVAYTMTEPDLGNDLYDLLEGERVGARLSLVEEEDGVPVLLVVDVLPARASGTPAEPAGRDLPQVRLDDTGAPTVRIPRADPPSGLVVHPLIRGTGSQVRPGQIVTVEFTAVRWSDGTVVDTTWSEGAPPQSAEIGIGKLVQGWDEGLVEQTVGSQVLLVVPPDQGYANTTSGLAGETMVYVVDILDTHQAVAEDGPRASGSEKTKEEEG
ncbi:FKBP-type peptidyl-prolyl cis-trans isomerase [Promicromonospora thailandica]|uniref:Peptidyl-prolyl cis-trans isomerase n=1 Tax=Promicromonospora thailandica TaxID=765201 RepID=A0A9X2GCN3_9MICO|nr:FKBP-type peptidyl-prolyl cis-trans isomerase [Promicromonospora thailandica]MCP2266756.1 peptidylprolyl isomerase [Promicromonospora thailandica]BFF21919.1 FKBP-type peptidyl-prolyl cis-trans isomerase [Promicromonospora thailandica]